MKILVVGGGAREHALLRQLSLSAQAKLLYCAPGNPGTSALAQNVPIAANDIEGLTAWVQHNEIGLVVVGPEEPLVMGLADRLRAIGVPVVGPSANAARLEASKRFAKAFMEKHGVPTAAYREFTRDQIIEAKAYVLGQPKPVVVKADGLAAGKGVAICPDAESGVLALNQMLLGGQFGPAGHTVVVEAFLNGVECSVFALCDGHDYVLLPTAKDYKRIFDGHKGPNTGGMGAVSPVFFADDAFLEKVRARVVEPTLQGMAAEGHPFQGFLFIGLMVVEGEPFVLEYNVRLGDPETEAMLPRIQSDFLALMLAAAKGKLAGCTLAVSPDASTTVVVASGGYPGAHQKGYKIDGLGDMPDSVLVFHAGTALDENQQLITNGGRVLAITALAPTPPESRAAAMRAAARVGFKDAYFRRDIGEDLLEMQETGAR